jgi:hypothetical protein
MRLSLRAPRRSALGQFGGFMLVDAERNFVVAGHQPMQYSFDLEGIEAWLTK